MGLSVIFRKEILQNFVRFVAQKQLNATCIPPMDGQFVDHLDITGVDVALTSDAVVITVRVAVFEVNLSDIEPGSEGIITPAGAFTPIGGSTVINMQLKHISTILMLRVMSINSPSAVLSAATSILQSSINSLSFFEVGQFFANFSLPESTVSVVTSGDLVGFQFATNDPLVDVGQDWDIAMDDSSIQTIITNRLSPFYAFIQREFRDPNMEIESRASGHYMVTITATGDYAISGIKIRDQQIFVYLDVLFELNSVWRNQEKEGDLIMKVNWSSYAGTDSSTQIFEAYIRPFLQNLGVTVVSSHSFMFTSPLPEMNLSDIHFLYSNVNATQPRGGIRLIGTAPDFTVKNNGIISINLRPFPSTYEALNDCGKGSHKPQAIASADIGNEGTICSINPISPQIGGTFDFISQFLAGSTITLPPLAGLLLRDFGQPIEILIKTTRGVRIVNFELPPDPDFDTKGAPRNSITLLGAGCQPRFGIVDPIHVLIPALDPVRYGPDPSPVWVNNIQNVARMQSMLIQLSEVSFPDVVMLNQPLDGGVSTFVAVPKAALTIPVVVPIRAFDGGMTLERMSRLPIGQISTSVKTFQRIVTLRTPGAISHCISSDGSGAVIFTTYKDRIEVKGINSLNVLKSLAKRKLSEPELDFEIKHNMRITTLQPSESMLDPETQTQSPSKAGMPHWNCELPGLVKVHYVPGFEKANVAIAEVNDGTFRSLSRDENGEAVVTGFLSRWPRIPSVSGDWALSSSTGEQVAIYSVATPSSDLCNCGYSK